MFVTVLGALACFVMAFLTDSSTWFYAGMVSMMVEWAISDWPYEWPGRLHEPLGWNKRHLPLGHPMRMLDGPLDDAERMDNLDGTTRLLTHDEAKALRQQWVERFHERHTGS
jgi:hypothetical protein